MKMDLIVGYLVAGVCAIGLAALIAYEVAWLLGYV